MPAYVESFLFMAAGCYAMIAAFYIRPSVDKLKKDGIKTTGIIVSIDAVSGWSFGRPSQRKKIVIRFETEEGELIEETVDQNPVISYTGQYAEGDAVELYYDRYLPTNFLVITKQPVLLMAVVFFLMGLSFFCLGLYWIPITDLFVAK